MICELCNEPITAHLTVTAQRMDKSQDGLCEWYRVCPSFKAKIVKAMIDAPHMPVIEPDYPPILDRNFNHVTRNSELYG